MALKLNGTNSVAAPAYAGDDADTGLQCGTNELKLVTGGTEAVTVDSSSRLLVGTSSKIGSTEKKIEVLGSSIGLSNFSNNAFGSSLVYEKGRGASVGTVVQDDDQLGSIVFRGDDGNDTFTTAASIECAVDATAYSNNMPGRLVFTTTSDGATSPTERMRIDSSGKVGINTDEPDALLNVSLGDTSTDTYFHGGGVRGLKISDSTDVNNGDTTTFHKASATGQYKFSNSTATRMHLDENGQLILTPAFGNNNNVLSLGIERAWYFKQINTGASTKIGFYSTSNKQFEIGGDTNGAPTMTVDTSTSKTVYFHGAVSKSGSTFRIDHPLPALTETHQLVHSVVEAPDATNLYAGMVDLVDGTATVNIDTAHRMTEGTFEALNHLQSWSSSNESGYAPVKCSMSGNLLTIECQDATSTDTVYYEVRGIRKDQYMMSADTDWTDENGRVITEPLKPTGETEDPS